MMLHGAFGGHSRETLRHSRAAFRHSRAASRHSREAFRHSRESGNPFAADLLR